MDSIVEFFRSDDGRGTSLKKIIKNHRSILALKKETMFRFHFAENGLRFLKARKPANPVRYFFQLVQVITRERWTGLNDGRITRETISAILIQDFFTRIDLSREVRNAFWIELI
jgi:hypothetical protein